MSDAVGERTFPCPRCRAEVSSLAFVCMSCQFELEKFWENRKSHLVSPMMKAPGDHSSRWMRDQYKKQSGCAWVVFVILGLLALFVPFIGIFAASVSFFFAFVTLFAPVTGVKLIEWLTNRPAYEAKRLRSILQSQNTYNSVSCPKCGFAFASPSRGTLYAWPDDKTSPLPCKACGANLSRVRDHLLWVPYPTVTLSGDLSEYVVD